MRNFSIEVDTKLLKLLNENIYQLELSRFIDSLKIENYIILFDTKSTQDYTSRFSYLTKVINEKFCGKLNTLDTLGETIDKQIINLKKYAIYLDNRYLKDYKIIKEETKTILKLVV